MSHHLLAIYRSGTRFYTSRPPSNCRSARAAWDRLATKKNVPLVELMLIEGTWSGGYSDGSSAIVDNLFEANRRIEERSRTR
jgi:hypothetical protein